MADKVVSMDDYREHRQGEARCLACGHEFHSVSPVVTSQWVQCPKCKLDKAQLVAPVVRPEPHWECKCGCDLFYMTPEWAYCPLCGTRHSYG